MKVLILHLSDIHIDGRDDYVTGRVHAIARSVRELESRVDLCVIVVSGDVAQSGALAEYQAAEIFFLALADQLKSELGLSAVMWVVAPGNHDCRFDSKQDVVRDTLLDAVRKTPVKATDAAMIDACTAPQTSFFQFLGGFAPPVTMLGPLCYEYRVTNGATTLVFRCLNTAWMSTETEVPASLHYPASAVPEPEAADVIVVTVHHHPSNWLEPNNRREFIKTIDKSSDLVLTGHEHDSASYVRIDSSGFRSDHLEGGVLQDRKRELPSSFNIVLLDLAVNTKAIAHFSFVQDDYVRTSGPLEHSVFARKRLCGRKQFSLSDQFRAWLDDPELRLEISAKFKLSLSDIFVWPDFREHSYTKPQRPLISAQTLLQRLSVEPRLLISGPDRSGKTAVCKNLYSSLMAEGVLPLYVAGRNAGLRASSIMGVVDQEFCKQYSRDDLSAYKQLGSDKRAIILDGAHLLQLTRGAKIQMLERLAQFARYVILTSDDMAQYIEDIVYSSESLNSPYDFKPYRLSDFGHVQRTKLAEKWLSIGLSPVEAKARVDQEWPEVRRVMDTIVGDNFVPSYPVFILAILQAREASRPLDTSASTYGYFYETFIRTALASGSKAFDPLTKREYLSRLARWMYDRRVGGISDSELRAFHADYEAVMQTRLAFTLFINELVAAEVLVTDGTRSAFKHRYMYYYFVAAHLSDHTSDGDTRIAIFEMAAHLHVEEFANVMLFLAHLSRDPYVIETMLAHAATLYAGVSPAELDGDVAFIGDGSDVTVAYTDEDLLVSRLKWLKQLDEYENLPKEEGDVSDASRDTDSSLDAVLQMNAAFKTLDVLGQILKNFAGAMEGDTKLRIATECYLLGLRVLGMALSMMRENREGFYAEMFRILRREHPDTRDAALLRRAEGAVFYFGQIMSYGMIRRISNALGSDRLAITYESVRKRLGSPAVKLVDVSLKLDNSGGVPELEIRALQKAYGKRPLVSSLLRQLVVQHFELFDVHVSTKQKICALLKIPYRTNLGADRREVLVASPAFKTPRLLSAPDLKR